jgi:hypothetical protein
MASLKRRAAQMFQSTTKTEGDIFLLYLAKMLVLEFLQHSVGNISQKFVLWAGLHFFCLLSILLSLACHLLSPSAQPLKQQQHTLLFVPV